MITFLDLTFVDTLTNPSTWVALLTLTFLEIILGIDNIVFISIVSSKLDPKEQPRARTIGLALAMVFRVILLFGIKWVMSLTEPFWHFNTTLLKGGLTGQSVIILIGGLFLIYKSVSEIHHKLEGEEDSKIKAKSSLTNAVMQIAALNLVFSFDSILTAMGMVSFQEFGETGALTIMIASVIISILIMMAFSTPVSHFVNKHPTIQMLGLSFLILIGVMLITEASHLSHLEIIGTHVSAIPKGYLYFAIFFAMLVEVLNMKLRKASKKPVKLHDSELIEENQNEK